MKVFAVYAKQPRFCQLSGLKCFESLEAGWWLAYLVRMSYTTSFELSQATVVRLIGSVVRHTLHQAC